MIVLIEFVNTIFFVFICQCVVGSRNNWDNTNENFILQSLVDGSLYLFFPSFVNPDVEMDDTEPS